MRGAVATCFNSHTRLQWHCNCRPMLNSRVFSPSAQVHPLLQTDSDKQWARQLAATLRCFHHHLHVASPDCRCRNVSNHTPASICISGIFRVHSSFNCSARWPRLVERQTSKECHSTWRALHSAVSVTGWAIEPYPIRSEWSCFSRLRTSTDRRCAKGTGPAGLVPSFIHWRQVLVLPSLRVLSLSLSSHEATLWSIETSQGTFLVTFRHLDSCASYIYI